MKKQHDNVQTYAYNAASWELHTNDRSQVLDTWNKILDSSIDLVSIQLGENVLDVDNYEDDFREMVQFVISKCPHAHIIIVDDFWSDENSIIKRAAIDGFDVEFIPLDNIRGDSKYKSSIGAIVYDAAGNEYTIKHKGVANHPGDEGMKYIADAIIEVIEKNHY